MAMCMVSCRISTNADSARGGGGVKFGLGWFTRLTNDDDRICMCSTLPDRGLSFLCVTYSFFFVSIFPSGMAFEGGG